MEKDRFSTGLISHEKRENKGISYLHYELQWAVTELFIDFKQSIGAY